MLAQLTNRCGICRLFKRQLFVNSFTQSASKSTNPQKSNTSLIRRYKWTCIIGIGGATVLLWQQTLKNPDIENPNGEVTALQGLNWLTMIYKCLPLKIMSRLWGDVNSIHLPMFMREPVLQLYSKAFNCNINEAAVQDLQHYRNLGEFFKRRLKPGVRPQDTTAAMTCPCDGRILHLGTVDGDDVEQVKGMTYSLQNFLGPPTWVQPPERKPQTSKASVPVTHTPMPTEEYTKHIKTVADTSVYHCVIYLAPGDYHGFHSPTEWDVTYRRHFPGELLSVSRSVSRFVQGLFCLNERSIYYGSWKEGFITMSAIGATNVGSMKIYHDQDLITNSVHRYQSGAFFDECFLRDDTSGIPMRRGESFGEFNLGSTIVLVFEAPKNFTFNVQSGQKVTLGQPLGSYPNYKAS